MAAVTKTRDGNGLFGPRWRIVLNGKVTPFCVEKSTPPKYGRPQVWDVIEGDNPQAVLYDAKSLDGALRVFRRIAEAVA